MKSKNALNLASFDGGGICGMSQLEILNHIMHQLNWDNKPDETDEGNETDETGETDGSHRRGLPCEHFDLLGGSGTGGLIAILLARLRMSVEEVSEELQGIMKQVFNPKEISASERTDALKKCMEDILKKKDLPVDLQLTETKREGCASFVVASPSTDAKSTIRLRTYTVGHQRPSAITVVEAVLATCATQPDFAAVTFGTRHNTRKYIAASGAGNPIHEVITEAHLLFGGDANVACLLSLGAGHPGIIPSPQDENEVALHKVVRDMMHNCQQRAQEVDERISRTGIYSRFSVDHGMQSDPAGKLDDPSWATAQMADYLSRQETGERLQLLAHNCGLAKGPVTLNQLKHAVVSAAPGHVATIVQQSVETLISNHDDEIIARLRTRDLVFESQVGTCLEGTRQDILEGFRTWLADLQSRNILWINGNSGVGKTAIASTIIEELRSSNLLGSSLFLQRELASTMTSSGLWRTVAYDLAQRHPGIRGQLVAALTTHPDLPTTSNVDALFRELLYEPLTKSGNMQTEKPLVVVLDAIDECGGINGRHSDNIKDLMRTLKRWSELPAKFKIIVTSRRESDIEELFLNTAHHPIEVTSGDAVTPETRADIRTLIVHELGRLQAQNTSLPPDWPGEEVISWLVDISKGLFICPTTVMKMLAREDPRPMLRQVLIECTGDMAELYTLVLETLFSIPSEDDIRNFRAVMGAIIFTRESLDEASLVHFLHIEESKLKDILTGLHSVLDCGNTIKVHHQSFVDFLIDADDCPSSFLINKERETRNLALCCLDTMKRHLRFNICNLESSYVRNQDVPDLAQRVDEFIPPYLSYSSRYWAVHLVETTYDEDINGSLQNFMDEQFLLWLE
ncbi:hypothetical protein M408DRAFT_31032, partial [Serendipita vermifera MAFF 305830]